VRPPQGSLEFLLQLNRIEAWVRTASSSTLVTPAGGLEEGITAEESVEIWRAKVAAYEKSLLDRLGCWRDIDKASAERYRSRIEDLGPTLQRVLDIGAPRRTLTKGALPSVTAAAAAGPVAVADAAGVAVARLLEAREAAAKAKKAKLEAAAEVSKGLENSETSGAPRIGEPSNPLESPVPDTTTPNTGAAVKSTATTSAPWRQPGRQPVNIASQRGQVEQEMLDITDNMKGLAQSWTSSLQRDNKVLDDIQDSQDTSQSKVSKANKTGKAMLWTGQLSFFKTMIMLAVSVVIFFMLIPFIIIT